MRKRVWLLLDSFSAFPACLLLGCLTSQPHLTCTSGMGLFNFIFRLTGTEAVDQTCHLTQSQFTETRQTSPSTNPSVPGVWQGSHWSINFELTSMTRWRKRSANLLLGDLLISFSWSGHISVFMSSSPRQEGDSLSLGHWGTLLSVA